MAASSALADLWRWDGFMEGVGVDWKAGTPGNSIVLDHDDDEEGWTDESSSNNIHISIPNSPQAETDDPSFPSTTTTITTSAPNPNISIVDQGRDRDGGEALVPGTMRPMLAIDSVLIYGFSRRFCLGVWTSFADVISLGGSGLAFIIKGWWLWLIGWYLWLRIQWRIVLRLAIKLPFILLVELWENLYLKYGPYREEYLAANYPIRGDDGELYRVEDDGVGEIAWIRMCDYLERTWTRVSGWPKQFWQWITRPFNWGAGLRGKKKQKKQKKKGKAPIITTVVEPFVKQQQTPTTTEEGPGVASGVAGTASNTNAGRANTNRARRKKRR